VEGYTIQLPFKNERKEDHSGVEPVYDVGKF
jgi:hypothetical protein